MNEKFFDIKKEKQDRMINAAIKFFAMQGYKHASTDDMVKEASISKGLLFHYFGSKAGIFQFVYDYSVRYTVLELSTMVNKTETDLFVLYKQIALARLRVMNSFPYMPKFLNTCLLEKDPDAVKTIEEKQHILTDALQAVYERMDFSVLPEGVSGERFCHMLDLAIGGLMDEHFVKEETEPDVLSNEIMEYLDMMRNIVMQR